MKILADRNLKMLFPIAQTLSVNRPSEVGVIRLLRFFSDRSHSPLSKRPGPLFHYKSLVNQGKLQHDPYQEKVAFELDNLLGRLSQYEKEMKEFHENLAKWEEDRENTRRKLLIKEAEGKQEGGLITSVKKRRNYFKMWMSRKTDDVEPGVGKWVSYLNRERRLDSLVGQRPAAPPAPKGLYVFGNVGSGKTMLMDMFYGATEGIVEHRKRLHFHETVDVFAIVALSGVLSRLLSTGTILVATSNRAPRDLNQDGMQKDIFMEFVTRLEERCENVFIGSDIDYRRQIGQRSTDQAHYFWPLNSIKKCEYEHTWSRITGQLGGKVISQTLQVMFGRTLEVPESCSGVARFSFEFLCGRPVGAADYIAIAKTYHTVFISDIPVMSMRIRDQARRFITLVDELYNHHCCLYCSVATSIEELFQGTEEGTLFDLESFQFETETEGSKLRQDVLAEGGVSSGGAPSGIISLLSGQEEMFAFRRAVSRLFEMQTTLYLERVGYFHPCFQGEAKIL